MPVVYRRKRIDTGWCGCQMYGNKAKIDDDSAGHTDREETSEVKRKTRKFGRLKQCRKQINNDTRIHRRRN